MKRVRVSHRDLESLRNGEVISTRTELAMGERCQIMLRGVGVPVSSAVAVRVREGETHIKNMEWAKRPLRSLKLRRATTGAKGRLLWPFRPWEQPESWCFPRLDGLTEFVVKWPNRCRKCRQMIRAGTVAFWRPGFSALWHPACVPEDGRARLGRTGLAKRRAMAEAPVEGMETNRTDPVSQWLAAHSKEDWSERMRETH